MAESGTRIQISPEIREKLEEHYQLMKSRGVKGLSKQKLIEELCNAGLELQNQIPVGSMAEPSQFGILHPQGRPKEYHFNTKSELKVMGQELHRREKRLILRERHLDEREDFINRKHYKALEEKELSIDVKSAIGKDPYKPERSDYDKERIHERDKTIEELKRENRELKNEMLNLLKKIDKKTEKGMMESVLSFITPALLGILLLKDEWKACKTDPELQKLIEMFIPKTKEEQEKLKKEMREFLKNGFSGNNSGQFAK